MKIITFILILFFPFLSLFSQDKNEVKKLNEAVADFKKANDLKRKYDFDNAKIYFEKAANVFKQYKKTGNYIQSRYSIADIYIQKNKKEEAEKIINEIYTLSIDKYGENNKFLTNILFAKGQIAAQNSKHIEALSFFRKSSELNDKFNKNESFFKSNLHTNIGNSYSELGKIDSALFHYKKDLEIKLLFIDAKHPMLSIAYNNIANIYKTKRQFTDAIKYIEKAIKLNLDAYGKDNFHTAKYYNGKGNIYSEMGQYDLALEFFQKSLRINKAHFGEKNINIAKDLNDIGIIYNKQRKYDKALIYFKDTYDLQVSLFGENYPDIAGTCNNIGYILEYQGKHESSLKYYLKAVKIKTKFFGENHPELATYYNNIGINYYNRSEYENALKNYLKSASILENNYGNKFPGIVRVYLNIANVYQKQENFFLALSYFQKSIAANVPKFNPETTNYSANPNLNNYLDINNLLFSLTGKAGILESIYQKDSVKNYLELAQKTYLLCDSAVSIARKQAIKKSDKIFLGNQSKRIYEKAVNVLIQLANKTENKKEKENYFEKAFYIAEKNKAAILSQAVNSSDAKYFADIPTDILKEEHDLKVKIANIEKSLAESFNEIETETLKERLFYLNEELRGLNNDIEREYPKYYNSKYKDIDISIKDIQKNIDKNTAIRSYFLGNEDIIIFTLTKNKIKVVSIGKPTNFEKDIRNFNKYITSGYKSYFKLYLNSANNFYKLFFPDIIPEEITKLIIIPDGIIGIIPFEPLITKNYTGDITNFKEYPFLIKKYQINYAYSASLLLKSLTNKRKRDNRKTWLGIAPVFDNITKNKINNIDVTPLPGTKTEIFEIEKLFQEKKLETKSITEMDATETFLKNENLKDYKYIHIASHGIVNTEEPKLSGIILHPQDTENDGVLYSGEIYNLELDADLTILSACETGLGEISKSEGVIGLSRALMYAGSDNTIVSLWKVSDVSTSDLMLNFYKNLLENEDDRAKALHNAKMKMIETGDNFAHPFFWSPFVLIGN